MKPAFLFFPALVLSSAGILWLPGMAQADQYKANNNTDLEVGASWASGVAPAGGDQAIWSSLVSAAVDCTNTLGAAAIWKSIVVSNPAAPVYISGDTTLTLSNGISLAHAAVDLTLDCGTIDLGGSQTWTVAGGRTLVTGAPGHAGAVDSPNNGNFSVTLTGGGVWTTSGTGDNGSSGVIVNQGTFNLNKTSSSGAHAIGGPGLTINSGATARLTGIGGDQIYDGASVTVAAGGRFDLNGNTETFANLYGNGVVDNTAPGTTATLTLGNGSCTCGGTLQNSGSGARLALVKAGTGTLTLSGANAYSGGTTISGSGAIALATTANSPMAYTNLAGTLSLIAAADTTLPMTTLVFGNSSPALTFNLGGQRNLTSPLANVTGNLVLNGNVTVNVANAVQSGTNVLLQYSGTRSGSGSFVAGSVPAGMTVVDDQVNQRLISIYASPNQPRVFIPTLNTNELVVALATPQQYGAVGDGSTDDSGAFQAAINAVYNAGGAGGGVVFVPAGSYAFYQNLTLPTGVTLHGDWQDWTKSGGPLAGTTFKIYLGAGQSNGTPFISMSHSTALRGINFWYPNQNATNPTAYPFSIQAGNDSVVANVALVNSYLGVTSDGDKNILRTVVGSPLALGIHMDQIFDVCHAEDVRFSPDLWPLAGVTNSPAAGGPQATWMRANGVGMQLLRVDGEMCMDTFISGYNIGIEALSATNGQPGVTFYHGAVTNCATALFAQNMPSAFGLMFADFTLDGDVAISRTDSTTDANALFYGCTIIGRNGEAVSVTGSDWHSWMQFQNCTISNALELAGPGVFNVVNSTLLGATQSVLSATATRAAFTGCTFAPAQNLVNLGKAGNLLVNAAPTATTVAPDIEWTNVINDELSRQPATTNLWVPTDLAFGASGDGVQDDTAAIQSALTAAGNGGGGIVYLPAGKYKLTSTLDVPSGVELRGAFEMRHRTQAAADGYDKGTILQPYGGQGATNGPPAIALETSSGVTGITASYETQNTNCIPFPPLIQGRGPNVYVKAVCCPNPYLYVDLATYTCTNHFLDMVDGWALKSGYRVGNGSSGTILDCHGNWTYWVDNGDSQSTLPGPVQAPVLSFASHNLEMYVLGNCRELMVKDFSIIEKTYLHLVDENGLGPNATLINNYCDASIQGFNLDAAAPACTLSAVNMPMTTFNFGDFSDQAKATVAVVSTTNFLGTAQFISSILWGGTWLDFDINGGDVSCDLVHMDSHSFIGSVVKGGVFRLVNNSAYISYNGSSNFPPYKVAFGPQAGLPGKTSEFSASYALNGCGLYNLASNNPVNCWNDYALEVDTVLDPTAPVIYGVYPDGSSIYQETNLLTFLALSPAGIQPANIRLTVDGVNETNLTISGPANSLAVAFPGLTLNRPHTAVISAIDGSSRTASTTVNFDTFDPTNYTFEAEDFDYGGGQFFANPSWGEYADRAGVEGVDLQMMNAGQGNSAYRPNPPGLETETASDSARQAYYPGLQDYDVGFNSGGNWGNYTRPLPAGTFQVYMRGANGANATADSASLALVTAGIGTTNQTSLRLGTFSVPATGGWQSYTWVPLADAGGNPLSLTNSGATVTWRITTDNGDYNANFYLLAPVYTPPVQVALAAATAARGVSLSFATQAGYFYQVEYKTNLSDGPWLPLGKALAGTGSTQSLAPAGAGTGFYRLRIQ
jgi:autotransporter-associated beta strand protein